MTDFLREQPGIAKTMQQEAEQLLAEINIRRFWRRMHHGHCFDTCELCGCGQSKSGYDFSDYENLEVCARLKEDFSKSGVFPGWFVRRALVLAELTELRFC